MPSNTIAIQDAIRVFLSARKELKLNKLSDPPAAKEIAALDAQFEPSAWLEDAVRRAGQLKLATHIAKSMHSGASGASSLYVAPANLRSCGDNKWVGSNCLMQFQVDASGNAASLDIYKFLMIEVDNQSFLGLVEADDADFKKALHHDPRVAQEWRDGFAKMLKPERLSAHSYTKQVLWPRQNDVHEDTDYTLLLPLHPISLIYSIGKTVQHDRFSEQAKLGRAARKENAPSATIFHEYPNIAVQHHGGTKPQNVSQLTSQLGGDYYVFASTPPLFKSQDVRPIFHHENALALFVSSVARSEMRATVQSIKALVQSRTSNAVERAQRDETIDDLADAFVEWTIALRGLDASWLQLADCQLRASQRAWFSSGAHSSDTIAAVSEALAQQVFKALDAPWAADDLFRHIKLRIEKTLNDFEG